jgi:hypothetical protein
MQGMEAGEQQARHWFACALLFVLLVGIGDSKHTF